MGIVAHRWAQLPFLPIKLLTLLGGETLAYMLIGTALYRVGLFDAARWGPARLKRVALRCYAISLPVLAAMTAWEILGGYNRIVVMGDWA